MFKNLLKSSIFFLLLSIFLTNTLYANIFSTSMYQHGVGTEDCIKCHAKDVVKNTKPDYLEQITPKP